MARKKKTKFVGFYLDEDDLEKLWVLSRSYEENNSRTMRAILNEAYENLIGTTKGTEMEKQTNERNAK